MRLPERVGPLLEKMRAFCGRNDLASFRNEARRRYFGEDLDPGPDEEAQYEDYLLHGYRDNDGQCLIDRFLTVCGSELDEAEKGALRSMRRSVYGLFKVNSVRPGQGLELQRVGSSERFWVVESSASRVLEEGAAIFARVIPYRGHHELTTISLLFPPDASYGIERMIRRQGQRAVAEVSDPLMVRGLHKKQRGESRRPLPPANRFEAELMAADLFARLGYSLSVEEVQERFQTMTSGVALFKDERTMPQFESQADFQAFVEAVQHLWNHTPRADLGGLTPNEKGSQAAREGYHSPPEHVIRDFMQQATAEIDPAQFEDDDSRREALDEALSRWLVTRQEELDGLSPVEAYGMGRIAPLPREEELPAADVPLWSRDELEPWLADGQRSPEGRIWALEWLCDSGSGEDVPWEKVLPLLGTGDEWTVRHVLGVLAGAPSARRSDAAAIVASRLEALRDLGEDPLVDGIDCLAELDPTPYLETFLKYLEDAASGVRRAAIRGVARAAPSGASGRLLALMDGSDCTTADRIEILGVLLASEDVDRSSRGAELLMERLDGDREFDIYDLPFTLCRSDWIVHLAGRVEDALFPDEYSGDDPPVAEADYEARARVFNVTSDPGASRRFREIVLPVRDRIFRLVDSSQDVQLVLLLRDTVQRVMEDAIHENPALAGSARALLAVVDVTSEAARFRRLSAGQREAFLTFFGVLLALGLRGQALSSTRDPVPDAGTALECCRIDLPWLTVTAIRELAPTLPAEPLQALAGSDDEFVRWNALALLAAKDPARYLNRALDASPPREEQKLVRAVCQLRGDVALPIVVGRALRDVEGESWQLVGMTARCLGTRRALEYFKRYFGPLATGSEAIAASTVIWMATAAREPGWAREVLDCLKQGELFVLSALVSESAREDLTRGVAVLTEATGLDEDPRALVELGLERYDEREAEEDEDEEEDEQFPGEWGNERDFGDSRLDEVPDTAPWGGASSTIRRETPKIGRNDPCPCGSGKKYKKCCGAG